MCAFLSDNSQAVYGSHIRKDNGYDPNSYTYYPVVILGAGASGIAMGCQLKEKLGFDQFRIFERQTGIGGTWYINRYPGVACDVIQPGRLSIPIGPEIVTYLQSICEKYEIIDKIQLNTDVTECRWIESEQIWEVTLQHLGTGVGDLSAHERKAQIKERGVESVYIREEKIRAKIVISAVGGLVEPRQWPENIPGSDKFQGEIFHSARWKHNVDLTDKNVIVVGTGCSAAQFVPKLTRDFGAKSVTQLMRSPPWVVPRPIPPWGNKKWAERAPWLNSNVPGFMKFIRFLVFAGGEYDWRLFGSDPYHVKEREKLEANLLAHMKETVPKKYHEILTPDYGVGCKRRIFDAYWLPSLNDPRIELTTLPLTSVQEKSVTLGPGRTYPDPKKTESTVPNHEVSVPADVIILANGFDTTAWLHPINIIGRQGKTLHKVFEERGGPQMYMGSALDGFPSFFCIFGPNTATGHSSVIMASENMVQMVLKLIKPILTGDVAITEIKKQAELDWAEDTQRALKKRVWHTGGCRSWYKTEGDWNSTVYPYTQVWFAFRCMFPTWRDWDITYTPKGLAKRRRQMLVRCLVLLVAVGGVLRLRQSGRTLRDIPAMVRGAMKQYLLQGASALQGISGRV